MDNKINPCDTMHVNLIAAAVGLQQCTKTASNVVPIPGGGRVIAIGTPAEVCALLGSGSAAPASPEQVQAEPTWYKPLPTPTQLLAVARDTGLRSYLRGVNSTEAKEILSVYIDAVRLLDTNYLPSLAAPSAAAPAAPEQDEVRNHALEEVAKLIDEKVESYISEHGSYDHTTGVTEYPGDGAEWVCEMEELAEEIRGMKTATNEGDRDA